MSDSDFLKDPYKADSASDMASDMIHQNHEFDSLDEERQEFDVDTWQSEYVEPVPVWLKFIVLLSVLMAFSLLIWTYYKKQDSNNAPTLDTQQENSLLEDELGSSLGAVDVNAKALTQDATQEEESELAKAEKTGAFDVQTPSTVSELVDNLNELDNVEEGLRTQSSAPLQQNEIAEEDPLTIEKTVVINQPEIEVVAEEIKEREVEKSKAVNVTVEREIQKQQALVEVKAPPVVEKKETVKQQVLIETNVTSQSAKKVDESTKLAEAVKRDAEKNRIAVQTSNYNYTLEYDGPSLRNMSSNNWAVQLIGMYDPEGFEKFVKQVNVNYPLYIYRRSRNGKIWHVAILGPFSTRAEAKTAVNSLPGRLKAHSPWIKSLGTIKQQL